MFSKCCFAQGEGENKGNLFSLGQHAALEAVKGRMVEEVLLAFLDDVYVITTPERVGDVYMARRNSTDTPGLVETDFGQTDFGHRYPTDFGQTDFGQTDFGHRYPTDFGQTDFGQTDFGQS